jgi:hypothetical protein
VRPELEAGRRELTSFTRLDWVRGGQRGGSLPLLTRHAEQIV